MNSTVIDMVDFLFLRNGDKKISIRLTASDVVPIFGVKSNAYNRLGSAVGISLDARLCYLCGFIVS